MLFIFFFNDITCDSSKSQTREPLNAPLHTAEETGRSSAAVPVAKA